MPFFPLDSFFNVQECSYIKAPAPSRVNLLDSGSLRSPNYHPAPWIPKWVTHVAVSPTLVIHPPHAWSDWLQDEDRSSRSDRYESLTVSHHVSFEGFLKGNVFVEPGGVEAFENLIQTFVSLGGLGGRRGLESLQLHVGPVFVGKDAAIDKDPPRHPSELIQHCVQ